MGVLRFIWNLRIYIKFWDLFEILGFLMGFWDVWGDLGINLRFWDLTWVWGVYLGL